jgi:hypothetical protein
MFLKEKRDGSLKGRTMAGGNKQRDYISKEDPILRSSVIAYWKPSSFNSKS